MIKMWLDRALSEDFTDILIVSEETPTLGCQTYLFCFWTWTFEFAFAFGFFENLLNLLLLLAPQTYISKAKKIKNSNLLCLESFKTHFNSVT